MAPNKTSSEASLSSLGTKSTSSTESLPSPFLIPAKPLPSNELFGFVASLALYTLSLGAIHVDTALGDTTKLRLMLATTVTLLVVLYLVQKAENHEVNEPDVTESDSQPPPGYIYREQDGRTVLVKAFHPPKSNRKVSNKCSVLSVVY